MSPESPGPKHIGRYVLLDEIAAGGMASVHLGRLMGPVGFSRTVAIKRLHPQYAKDPQFVSMFLDEARLAARIRHPNVAATIDVDTRDGELFLVMEYVHGASFARLLHWCSEKHERAPVPIVLSIVIDILYGLHAAHEAKGERGEPLMIVHRDVSPHNVMVGKDGIARVLDFGIAKAASRTQTTREGHLKGKLSYMAPEQLSRGNVDRRADVFAASVVLWEALAGKRLFEGDDVGEIVSRVLGEPVDPPSRHASGIPSPLDAAVLKGLARDPGERFASAHEMASALETALAPARAAQVGAWVEQTAGDVLEEGSRRLAEIESGSAFDGGAPRPRAATVPTMQLEGGQLEGGQTAKAQGANTAAVHEVEQEGPTHPRNLSPAARSEIDAPPRPSARRRIGVLVLAVAAMALLTLAARWLRPATAPVPEGFAQPPPPATVSIAIGAASPEPIDSVLGAPTPSVTAQGPTRTPSTPARPAAGTRTHGKRDCDPPYFFDSEGVKRFKPGCV
jgi:serine/threonine-protein kinase